MVRLRIWLEDAPTACGDYTRVQPFLQTKKQMIPAAEQAGADVAFDVTFDLVEGVPKGEAIYYYGDKRRFIYIAWRGSLNGAMPAMFRRIKLYADQLPPLVDGTSLEVRIAGRDAKGMPACSTAKVLAR